MIGGSLCGLITALARLSHIRAVSWLASISVDFFRTTPLLIQLVWFYFALPMLVGYSLSGIQAASIGLSLYAGSFIAEVIRAGILSIDRGQSEAALALGMSRAQALQRIVLPQAIIRMLPPITSIFISIIKDSSLVSIISVPELMRQTDALASFTLRRMEGLTVAAGIYLLLTFPLSLLVDAMERRLSHD